MSAYSAAVLANSPVAYYRMNEASGQPQDLSGNANHTTTTTGTPTYSQTGALTASGDSDTAIDFTGSQLFTAPDANSLDVGDVFSIELWIKRHTAIGVNSILVTKGTAGGNAFEFKISTSDVFVLSVPNVAQVAHSTPALTDTASWHHIVCTKNGATTKIYQDNVDVTVLDTNGTATSNTDVLSIGGQSGANFLNGTLDEVAIYSTALSASDVSAHYNAATLLAGGAIPANLRHLGFGPF